MTAKGFLVCGDVDLCRYCILYLRVNTHMCTHMYNYVLNCFNRFRWSSFGTSKIRRLTCSSPPRIRRPRPFRGWLPFIRGSCHFFLDWMHIIFHNSNGYEQLHSGQFIKKWMNCFWCMNLRLIVGLNITSILIYLSQFRDKLNFKKHKCCAWDLNQGRGNVGADAMGVCPLLSRYELNWGRSLS